MLQTGSGEKVVEKNGVICCHVSFSNSITAIYASEIYASEISYYSLSDNAMV